MKIQINKKAKASAIMLVLFILTGVMLVVFGSSSVIISGLKMGNVQSQSTRAYFTAEAGAERLLYDFRKDNLLNTIGETTPQENIFPYYEVHEGKYNHRFTAEELAQLITAKITPEQADKYAPGRTAEEILHAINEGRLPDGRLTAEGIVKAIEA